MELEGEIEETIVNMAELPVLGENKHEEEPDRFVSHSKSEKR
jgi:hypothetical protein